MKTGVFGELQNKRTNDSRCAKEDVVVWSDLLKVHYQRRCIDTLQQIQYLFGILLNLQNKSLMEDKIAFSFL